jgi:hypothetical protein
MEMVLVLFYAEEPLKRILDVGDKVHDESPNDAAKINERPCKTRENRPEKAFRFLVTDGIFNASEKKEIVQVIDYRNHIATFEKELKRLPLPAVNPAQIRKVWGYS